MISGPLVVGQVKAREGKRVRPQGNEAKPLNGFVLMGVELQVPHRKFVGRMGVRYEPAETAVQQSANNNVNTETKLSPRVRLA